MSQRNSEYDRIDNDKYETPFWVVECLFPHIPNRIIKAFDPCCGSGHVVRALQHPFRTCALDATGKDLERGGYDYLKDVSWHEAIITNPPFSLAEKFAVHALGHSHFVALLLRTDFDHAKTRQYLFKNCPEFSKEIKLLDRITWVGMEINPRTGKKAAPSENHSWFIWDCAREQSAPTVCWEARRS